MALTVTVGGTDRTDKLWFQGGISYDDMVSGQGQAHLVFRDTVGGFVPADGQEVLIKQSGTTRFTGLLMNPRRYLKGPDASDAMSYFDCDIGGYELLLRKRLVFKEYVKQELSVIIADLNTTFLSSEGFTVGGVETGPTISITFNGENVAEALDELMVRAADGRSWWIATGKVITAQVLASSAFPATLDKDNIKGPKTPGAVRPDVRDDRTTYANVVTVRAGDDNHTILVQSSDAVEITARIAAEGGSGRYEAPVLDLPEIKTEVEAQAAADAKLAQVVLLNKEFVCTTDVLGFAQGQQGIVNLPNLGLSNTTMFITAVKTHARSLTEFWHDITAVTGDPGQNWQAYYREAKRKTKTIPLRFQPAEGIVRVETKAGVLVHDPMRDPTEWFQGSASGALDNTPSAQGITHDRKYVVTLRRGGAVNTGGCTGGKFPGGPIDINPACHGNRQSILELWLITNHVPATSPSFSGSFDEFEGGTEFKTTICISPDNSKAAFVMYGAPGTLVVLDLINMKVLGSVATNMTANATGNEPLWVDDHIFWPDGSSTGDMYVFAATDPTVPTEAQVFNSVNCTNISSVCADSAGTSLFASGVGAVISIDATAPAAITETQALTAIADYPSIALDQENDLLGAAVRLSGTQINVLTISVVADAMTLEGEVAVAVTQSQMAGVGAIHHLGSLIVFSELNAAGGIGDLDAHVFDTTVKTAPVWVEKIDYSNTASGCLGPDRTLAGFYSIYSYNFGSDVQVTHGVEVFDRVEPYELDDPLRGKFGGTGQKVYERGDLLVGLDGANLTKLNTVRDGRKLMTDAGTTSGLVWADNELLEVVAINDGDSPYTIVAAEDVILADATSGAITVNLPALATNLNRALWIKDVGDGSNDVTLDGNGAETIDGAATYVLPSGGDVSVMLVAAAGGWSIVAAWSPTGTIDHGGLTGLTDVGHHPGYVTLDGLRELTAPWDAGGFQIRAANFVADAADSFILNGFGLVIGHTAQILASNRSEFQVLGTSGADGSIVIARFSANDSPPSINLLKSRSGVIGVNGIVVDGDILGQHKFLADDGSDFSTKAAIFMVVVDDPSPAVGDIGAAYEFYQMPGGGGASRLTMRLNAAGLLDIVGALRALTLESDVATGTPPLVVASTTNVANLDADTVDGIEGAEIIQRDGAVPFTGEIDAGGQLIDNAPFMRGYIDGFQTSNDTDSDHDILIGPGVCADVLVNNDRIIELLAAFTKQIDAAWAEGDDAGGMATGTVAADTEYNEIIIEEDATPGNIDAIFDVSTIGANAPIGWTAVRRIGSVFTDASANIFAFTQVGDFWTMDALPPDVNNTTGTVGVFETATLTAPPNSIVICRVNGRATSSTNVGVQLRLPGGTGRGKVFYSDIVDTTTRQFQVALPFAIDGSSQIQYTLSQGVAWDSVSLQVHEYWDRRGRDA